MFIIAGLGNPGDKYAHTRHNAGFDTVDKLADKYGIDISEEKFEALLGRGVIEGQKVILVKPLTYMNNSGQALRAVADYYKVDTESELIVIYDDISLEPGKLRVRPKGSAGGHNGIKSIIQNIGTEEFDRIKIGVGHKPENFDLIDHVLGRFPKEQLEDVRDSVSRAVLACEEIIMAGAASAINKYN